MSKKKTDTQEILNVFITYRRKTGEAYIDRVKQLLDACIEKVTRFDGYDLIYDRNVGYDYNFIDRLYNITDLDIFLISNEVDQSDSIKKELKAMKDRGIPIIPVRFEGYEGDDIRLVINPDSVDALPIDLPDGKEPDEETVQSMVFRMNQCLERYDRRKRDKISKEIMKNAKVEENGVRVSGWLVETGKRVAKSAGKGAEEGVTQFAQSATRWIVYTLLVILLLAALGVAWNWEQVKQIMIDHFLPEVSHQAAFPVHLFLH